MFERATGCFVYDTQGKQYIDFFCGAGALNYGHNHPAMKAALIRYLDNDGLVHGLDMATCAKERFLELFDSMILQPRGMNYKIQFVGPTGTNGVEAALKLARLVTKRQNVIAFTNSYHGLTAGALAVTASRYYRSEYFGQASQVTFLPFDGFFGAGVDTVAFARQMIMEGNGGIDPPAAVIVETIQAEGGVNVAGRKWLRDLQQLCDDCRALLIVDDIQVGNGRTGDFFSFESAAIQPDIVIVSKSISGIGLPMSIVLLDPEIDQWKPGQHTGTFRGNNLAFVTAGEALRFWETELFSREVHRRSDLLRQRLEEIARRYPQLDAQIRGRGMIQGLEIADPGRCKAIARSAFQHGLIVETCGPKSNVLKFLPPLVITDDILYQGLEIIETSICEVSRGDVQQLQSVKPDKSLAGNAVIPEL